MGGSIAEGLLRSGQVPAANLWLANPHPGKLARFQEQGAHVVTDNTEAVKEAQSSMPRSCADNSLSLPSRTCVVVRPKRCSMTSI